MADRRPVIMGPDDAWKRLGELLQLRRAELGYKRRPAFTRERGINIRLVTDIENAYRPNTFLTPTLREIAQAYQVTYDSIVAIVLGHDDELIPAAPTALPVPGGPPGWLASEEGRVEADRPYVDRIRGRLDVLRLQGVTAPTGAQLFGEGTPDAADWNRYAADGWTIQDLAWFIGDMQRRNDDRAAGGNSGTGTNGALCRG
jgi:hypothetical protein